LWKAVSGSDEGTVVAIGFRLAMIRQGTVHERELVSVRRSLASTDQRWDCLWKTFRDGQCVGR